MFSRTKSQLVVWLGEDEEALSSIDINPFERKRRFHNRDGDVLGESTNDDDANASTNTMDPQGSSKKKEDPNAPELRGKARRFFAWFGDVEKDLLTRNPITKCEVLNDIMSGIDVKVSEALTNCYSKPFRALLLQVILEALLPVLHYTYEHMLSPPPHELERKYYLFFLTDLLSKLIDLKLRSAKVVITSRKLLAQEIATLPQIYLDGDDISQCEVFLKCNFFHSRFSDICAPVLSSFLTRASCFCHDELTYMRYIILFKMWRKHESSGDKRIKISRIAENKLRLSPHVIEGVKKLTKKLPSLPWAPNINKQFTTFLMSGAFNCPLSKLKEDFVKAFCSKEYLWESTKEISKVKPQAWNSQGPSCSEGNSSMRMEKFLMVKDSDVEEIVEPKEVEKPVPLCITIDDEENNAEDELMHQNSFVPSYLRSFCQTSDSPRLSSDVASPTPALSEPQVLAIEAASCEPAPVANRESPIAAAIPDLVPPVLEPENLVKDFPPSSQTNRCITESTGDHTGTLLPPTLTKEAVTAASPLGSPAQFDPLLTESRTVRATVHRPPSPAKLNSLATLPIPAHPSVVFPSPPVPLNSHPGSTYLPERIQQKYCDSLRPPSQVCEVNSNTDGYDCINPSSSPESYQSSEERGFAVNQLNMVGVGTFRHPVPPPRNPTDHLESQEKFLEPPHHPYPNSRTPSEQLVTMPVMPNYEMMPNRSSSGPMNLTHVHDFTRQSASRQEQPISYGVTPYPETLAQKRHDPSESSNSIPAKRPRIPSSSPSMGPVEPVDQESPTSYIYNPDLRLTTKDLLIGGIVDGEAFLNEFFGLSDRREMICADDGDWPEVPNSIDPTEPPTNDKPQLSIVRSSSTNPSPTRSTTNPQMIVTAARRKRRSKGFTRRKSTARKNVVSSTDTNDKDVVADDTRLTDSSQSQWTSIATDKVSAQPSPSIGRTRASSLRKDVTPAVINHCHPFSTFDDLVVPVVPLRGNRRKRGQSPRSSLDSDNELLLERNTTRSFVRLTITPGPVPQVPVVSLLPAPPAEPLYPSSHHDDERPVKKKRGRPVGSKNKKNRIVTEIETDTRSTSIHSRSEKIGGRSKLVQHTKKMEVVKSFSDHDPSHYLDDEPLNKRLLRNQINNRTILTKSAARSLDKLL